MAWRMGRGKEEKQRKKQVRCSSCWWVVGGVWCGALLGVVWCKEQVRCSSCWCVVCGVVLFMVWCGVAWCSVACLVWRCVVRYSAVQCMCEVTSVLALCGVVAWCALRRSLWCVVMRGRTVRTVDGAVW